MDMTDDVARRGVLRYTVGRYDMDVKERARGPGGPEGFVPDVRYDDVFKAVFADGSEPRSRGALSGLLSAVTGRRLRVAGVLRDEPATGFAGEKRIRYDVSCVADDGSRHNVEMTLHPTSCEPVRMEYYAAKAHTGQPARGRTYSEVTPTCQVSVLGGNVFDDGECLHAFSFHDAARGTPFGGRLSVFTLELRKVEAVARAKAARDMSPAERWASYFRYNADGSEFARKLLEEIMEEEEGVRMAAEVVSLFSEDEERFFWNLSREKYETDRYNLMMDAEERGRTDERRKAEAVIAGKDAALADKDAALAGKDAVIADKDAEIARLRALLGEGS
jgi:predicted transposase/invertase (TIGR01784 family)